MRGLLVLGLTALAVPGLAVAQLVPADVTVQSVTVSLPGSGGASSSGPTSASVTEPFSFGVGSGSNAISASATGNEVHLQYDVAAITPSGTQSLTLTAHVLVDLSIVIPGGAAPLVPVLLRWRSFPADPQMCDSLLEITGGLDPPRFTSDLLGGESYYSFGLNQILDGIEFMASAQVRFDEGARASNDRPSSANFVLASDVVHATLSLQVQCRIQPENNGTTSLPATLEIVTIPPGTLGDVNADGTTNLVDSTILRRVLAGEPVP